MAGCVKRIAKDSVNYCTILIISKLQRQCNVEEVAIFPAGSEGFSQKNLNCSVKEGLRRFKDVADQAVKEGLRVRGYVSCVVGCPYDGPVEPKAIAKVIINFLKEHQYKKL